MITAQITIPVAPLYLLTTDYTMIVVFFTLQGWFGGGDMHTQSPHYLSERFPTEVRATAPGFCYHQGQSSVAWWGRSSLTLPPIGTWALRCR
jgi:SHS family lactate transporter-like MFS transporter